MTVSPRIVTLGEGYFQVRLRSRPGDSPGLAGFLSTGNNEPQRGLATHAFFVGAVRTRRPVWLLRHVCRGWWCGLLRMPGATSREVTGSARGADLARLRDCQTAVQ